MAVREHRSLGYLRLARHHLVDDHDELSRSWAYRHMLSAMEEFERSGILDADLVSPAIRPLILRSAQNDPVEVPKPRVLWNALEELERLGLQRLTHRWWNPSKTGAQILRDIGVVLVCAVILGIAYRKYSGLPVNVWAKTFEVMDVEVKSSSQGYGQLQINKTADQQPVIINGRHYARALGTHAVSQIDVRLTRSGKFFSGTCAYPDSVSGAEIYCTIDNASSQLWRSQNLSASSRMAPFKIEVSGQQDLILRVYSATEGIGAAHAAWVELKVLDE